MSKALRCDPCRVASGLSVAAGLFVSRATAAVCARPLPPRFRPVVPPPSDDLDPLSTAPPDSSLSVQQQNPLLSASPDGRRSACPPASASPAAAGVVVPPAGRPGQLGRSSPSLDLAPAGGYGRRLLIVVVVVVRASLVVRLVAELAVGL
jgi:hypothetical protein